MSPLNVPFLRMSGSLSNSGAVQSNSKQIKSIRLYIWAHTAVNFSDIPNAELHPSFQSFNEGMEHASLITRSGLLFLAMC